MIDAQHVSLGILAGGRGSRLSGADKALLEYQGAALLPRILRACTEPFAERLLSYNREPGPVVSAFGLRIVPDLRPGQQGPLAALEALLVACKTPWLLTIPVDIRDLPPSLTTELIQAESGAADGCVLRDADGLQPLVGLWKVSVLRDSVTAAIDSGERAVHRWLAATPLPVHDISPWRLGNLNAPADFAAR
jgi:molybdopterin-guanine dinucleotide biosynthesis protein A